MVSNKITYGLFNINQQFWVSLGLTFLLFFSSLNADKFLTDKHDVWGDVPQ